MHLWLWFGLGLGRVYIIGLISGGVAKYCSGCSGCSGLQLTLYYDIHLLCLTVTSSLIPPLGPQVSTFVARHGHCWISFVLARAIVQPTLHKWRMAASDKCQCGEVQTMSDESHRGIMSANQIFWWWPGSSPFCWWSRRHVAKRSCSESIREMKFELLYALHARLARKII